jgi:hypothetical protein
MNTSTARHRAKQSVVRTAGTGIAKIAGATVVITGLAMGAITAFGTQQPAAADVQLTSQREQLDAALVSVQDALNAADSALSTYGDSAPAELEAYAAATADRVAELTSQNLSDADTISAVADLTGRTIVLVSYSTSAEQLAVLEPVADEAPVAEEATEAPAETETVEQVAAPVATQAPATTTTKTTTTTTTQAPAQAAAPAAPAAPAARQTSYTINVRTSVVQDAGSDVSKAQAELDRGGQISISYPGEGFTIVVAHNFNDDTALSLQAGDTVTFTGAQSGTYKVVNMTNVSKTTGTTEDLRGLGTSMLMQTCNWDDVTMHVVGLVKI